MNPRQRASQWLLVIATLSGPGGAAAEEAMGRLFFTQEKRELLDRQRALNILESEVIAEDPQIVVNGQVRRSSGKRTTWINGQAQDDTQTRTGVIAHPAAQGHERVIIESGDDPRAAVRVGETLSRGTQETHDVLGDGKIMINRPGSKSGH
ncbi:MAG: hypothetical protein IPL58_14015 [Betaproteobacteria bacterium]|uniref:Uncharacterized protein n=1 Tax=Candidatus Proximibacter danicus TaxID=2954365 RepID=A0A9D7K5L4_9PROT|nr:hypothetical protein [Candidatus Proximibacter danicus]